MKIERSKNARRNIKFGMINKVISMLLPFIIRTVMIKTLGAEYLGLDSLFASILQVLNLTELGFSSAVVYSMYKPIAEDDTKTVCALLNLYRKIYRYIGIIILALGLCLTPFLPHLINNDPSVGGGLPGGLNIYAIYLVYLINTVLGYLLFAYKNSIPNATQRVDIVTNVHLFAKTITSVAQIVILFALSKGINDSSTYYLYILMLPICTLINNIVVSIFVDRKYPQYRCMGTVPEELIKDIKTKVTGLFISKVCNTTRNSLDSICISAFLGLTLTTIYNNYFYIITAVIGVISVINSSILAGVGNSIVLDTKEKNYSDMRRMNFIYMWLCGFCTICMLTFFQPFMELWVGSDLMFSFGIVVCFCLYFYTLKMGDIRSVYVEGAGLWWENRYRAIAESLINITLNVILVQVWGVYGIIIATLISLFFINFILGSQIVFKYYFQNNKLREYFLDHLLYFLVTCSIGAVTICACIFANMLFGNGNCLQGTGHPIKTLIVNIIITLLVPNVLYFLIYHKSTSYKVSVSWLSQKFGKNGLAKKILDFMIR